MPVSKIFIILCIPLLALFFYSVRLNIPDGPVFDEHLFVPTAKALLDRSDYIEDTHPPLGKLLIAGSIATLGDHPWAWRVPSLICSTLSLVLIALIAWQLSGSLGIGLLAQSLLALDGLWMMQARIGMLNAPLVFFMLLSVSLSLYALSTGRLRFWLLSAIAGGMALATKWSSVSLLLIIIPLMYQHKATIISTFKLSIQRIVVWVLIGLGVYFATFLIIPFIHGRTWADIWNLQYEMFSFHHNLTEKARYASSWWSWPLLLRPHWYGFMRVNPDMPQFLQTIQGLLCIGNPLVFLLMPISMVCVGWHYVKTRHPLSLLILLGFATQWLQCALVTRFTLFHHYYPAMPFVGLAIAFFLKQIWDISPLGKIVVGVYLFFTLLMFTYWYPLWTYLPISYTWYENHLWLPSWK